MIYRDQIVSIPPIVEKAVCFFEVIVNPYSINDLSGVSLNLINGIVVGKAKMDSIPSPSKRALEHLLKERKKQKLDEEEDYERKELEFDWMELKTNTKNEVNHVFEDMVRKTSVQLHFNPPVPLALTKVAKYSSALIGHNCHILFSKNWGVA